MRERPISLDEVRALGERRVAGLMTGTSMDGLDVAICRIEPGERLAFELLAFETVPMPDDLRRDLAPERLDSIAAVARVNQRLGAYFADALSQAAGPTRLELIGSHGQTVYHEHGVTSLQLGDPCPLAAAFGCPVVSDFRMNDIALGGSGAPLVPYVDQRLLGRQGEALLAINIGGIANFTALPGDPAASDRVIGMDCGPGNMLMDGLARRRSRGRDKADMDGRLALRGKVDERLLAWLTSHPYFAGTPRASAGREQFGDDFLDRVLEESGTDLGDEAAVSDLMATLAAFTVFGITDAYRRFVAPGMPVEQVIVSGGGSRNPALMAGLSAGFGNIAVAASDRVGLPVDAKEAIAFAILASDRVDRRPTSLPSVTGARRQALLGKITEC
ncbi:MAG: anhydro-N-acetylmuramic acid kinase [Alphaproteobacteria bacterium]